MLDVCSEIVSDALVSSEVGTNPDCVPGTVFCCTSGASFATCS